MLKDIDFIKEAADSLKVWIEDRRDRALFTALANDLTNCVVCDGTNGFKDTTANASVKAAAQSIVAGDTINVKAIQRMRGFKKLCFARLFKTFFKRLKSLKKCGEVAR